MIINQSGRVKPKPPFFSVIITAYNRSALLVRALDSLISQTENNWEAIIIDDGSTDDTARRIAPFLKFPVQIFPEIAVIFLKEKSGLGAEVNLSI